MPLSSCFFPLLRLAGTERSGLSRPLPTIVFVVFLSLCHTGLLQLLHFLQGQTDTVGDHFQWQRPFL